MKLQKKESLLLVGLLVGILAAGGVFLYGGKPGLQDATLQVSQESGASVEKPVEKTEVVQPIKVHVKGEVHQPGVYQLPGDSRAIDAITAAGGAKPDGDLNGLNLAAVVSDGAEVIVPRKGEAVQAQAEGRQDGKVNLNTATLEELDKLPGIGSTRAQAIIQYRQDHGRFLKVEDLKNVQGFGVKLFDQIKDKVVVQ